MIAARPRIGRRHRAARRPRRSGRPRQGGVCLRRRRASGLPARGRLWRRLRRRRWPADAPGHFSWLAALVSRPPAAGCARSIPAAHPRLGARRLEMRRRGRRGFGQLTLRRAAGPGELAAAGAQPPVDVVVRSAVPAGSRLVPAMTRRSVPRFGHSSLLSPRPVLAAPNSQRAPGRRSRTGPSGPSHPIAAPRGVGRARPGGPSPL